MSQRSTSASGKSSSDQLEQGRRDRVSAKAQSLEAVTATLTTKDRLVSWRQSVLREHWRFALSGLVSAVAASAVGFNIGLVDMLDRQMQTLFFELRGPVAAPEDIVIVTKDEETVAQGKFYAADPERYAAFEPISSKERLRGAYARIIDRTMGAGAKAVALDILLDEESNTADDTALAEAISNYPDRVVIAGRVIVDVGESEGFYTRSQLPIYLFEDAGARIGIIDTPYELNKRIHRLSQTHVRNVAEIDSELLGISVEELEAFEEPYPSFAQATLRAAEHPLADVPRENIFFHGPSGTFQHIPLWKILDENAWENELEGGRVFDGKTVIVGTTVPFDQDFHSTPFSESLLYPQQMPGVEIQANAIATLQNDLSPQELIQNSMANALLVLGLGLAVAGVANLSKKPLNRLAIAGGSLGLWTLVSYGAFVGGSIIIMSGVPTAMLVSMGLLDFGVSFGADRLKRRRLRKTLARYATSPLVQEIISQQDDFQDLLDVNRADLIGTLLRDRYRITKVLGAGGFGETYLAQDTLRPGNPVCVVKQLKIVSDNPKAHQLARRLFESEAVVLGQLGEHNQIPRLLAYFEVQESFYLVQEMIEGKLLRDLLARSQPLSQRAVVRLLLDLLPVVSFVHSQGVIHRDIKPSNIIRRDIDKRYILIDFGAVKTISNKLANISGTQFTSTVGIGTQGYMPSEQSAGMPSVRSDLYALGITAIEALTGCPPHALKRSEDGEIIWSHRVTEVSLDLSRIISKMVRYDFNKRYAAAEDVIEDLGRLDLKALYRSNLKEAETDTINQTAEGHEAKESLDNPNVQPTSLDEADSGLDATEILPTNWPNEMTTSVEKTSEEKRPPLDS